MALLSAERDETDRRLASERREADRVLAVRDYTLGIVSHDLRSLLAGVLMRSSTLVLAHPQDAELARHVTEMQRAVGRMDMLLSDLLDVASMDLGRTPIEPSAMDLVSLVTDELRVHRLATEARSIDLALEVHDDPIMVELDPMRMSRALMNVLTNALKFTPEGGRVDVGVERQGNKACISVRDRGPGIAHDNLETVFERFRRNDPLTPGYGLGLYIARAIVNAHSGRIWVDSKVGEGSTVWICVPALEATEAPAPTGAQQD